MQCLVWAASVTEYCCDATVCHAFVENTPNHKCTFWWNMVDFDGSGGPGVPGTSRGVAYGREMMFREFIHRFHTFLDNS